MTTNWQTKKLGEVADILMGQSPPSNTYNDDSMGLPFFQGKADFNDLYPTITKYCSKPVRVAGRNDVLLSVRAPVGPVNLSPSEICIGRGLSAIKGKQNVLNQMFLFYFMKLNELALSRKGTGSTFSSINRRDIEKIELPLPSLPIQQQIVEKLDSIRKLQELNQKEIEKTEELLRTQLSEEFVEADNWQGQKVKNVSLDIITGKTPSTQNKDYFMAEISWATPGDFDENRMWVESTKRKISQLAIDKGIVKLVPKKSLMVVCIGATIGKIGLTFYEMATNQQINSIVFDEKKILPEFGFYYFHRDKRLITKQAKQTTLPILNKGLTGELIIKYPDMKVQRQIINRLNAIYDHKAGLFLQRIKLTELFKSTLNKLMRPN